MTSRPASAPAPEAGPMPTHPSGDVEEGVEARVPLVFVWVAAVWGLVLAGLLLRIATGALY